MLIICRRHILHRSIVIYIILFFVLVRGVRAQNFVFAQLTGSPVNTAGWNMQGSARIANVTGTDNSEILVCPAINGTSGAIFYNQPINLSLCSKWKAEFDFRLYDGNAADGLAFCFLDVPPSGFVVGGGLGIPAGARGLKVCFDTWNNCLPWPQYNVDVPKIELRWGAGYDECGSLPTRNNADGQLSFMRSPNYSHAKIEYDNGNINVYVNDVLYLSGFQQFNFAGYLGFTASTGGFTDNHSIKNVVIYTEMPPSFAGNNASVCPKDTVQLGGVGNTQYVYAWSPANGLTATNIPNPAVSLDNNTGNVLRQDYYVRTSFANNPGCSSVDSITVIVNPKPQIDFNMPVVCLPNGNTVIQNNTAISDGTQNQLSYNWLFSDGTSSAEVNPSHLYQAPGNYTVKQTAATVNGCIASLTKNITINPQTKMAIAALNEFCADSLMQFNGTATGTSTVNKWQWRFGDGLADSLQNPRHRYAAADTVAVTLYSISTEGCNSDTATRQIIVNSLPSAGFVYGGLSCINQTINFKDNSKPNVGSLTAQSWLFDNGTTATGSNITHSYTADGLHPVTLTVKNSKGCLSKLVTQNILINPSPKVSFLLPAVCFGNSGTFIDSSTITDLTQNQFTYKWSFGDGVSGTAANPLHTYTNAGNYSVKLKVTSIKGCSDSLIKTIAVSDYPVTDFKILTTDFCGNLPLLLQDNSVVNYATIDYLKIYWNWPSQDDTAVYNNPTKGTSYSHNYTSFGNVAAKQFDVKVEAYSTGGCHTEKYGNSILFAAPRLAFDAIPLYCNNVNDNILLTQARDTSFFAGTGFYYGDGIASGKFFNPSVAGAGNHLLTFKYALINGCTDSVTQIVKIALQPTVNAGADEIILQGGSIALNATAGGGNSLQYTWSPAAGLSNTTIPGPTASPARDTYYTLEVVNENGCSNKDEVLIKVLQTPVIPNVFSPNNDGINDTWQITYLNSYPDCVVNIFNRYGQAVFHSAGYKTAWDGNHNGKLLPVGTYYYVIDTRRITKVLTGSVTLLR